jgi:uncharacterized protein (DUF924 family)
MVDAVLTPAVLSAALRARLPWDKTAVQAACGETLAALSQRGPAGSLMGCLPPPEAAQFPEQALGLVVVLDQAPRALLRGRDQRWTNGFFHPLVCALVRDLFALPPPLRPHGRARWVDGLGASFEFWAVAWLWLVAPLVHSEALEDHDVVDGLVEEMRAEVEVRAATSDPHRPEKEEGYRDTTLFAKMVREGPPRGDGVRMQDFMFWLCKLLDVHRPIIEVFGRYPYRNLSLGRTSTEAEAQWLVETGLPGGMGEADAQRIREDVLAGRWTPLGGAKGSS